MILFLQTKMRKRGSCSPLLLLLPMPRRRNSLSLGVDNPYELPESGEMIKSIDQSFMSVVPQISISCHILLKVKMDSNMLKISITSMVSPPALVEASFCADLGHKL